MIPITIRRSTRFLLRPDLHLVSASAASLLGGVTVLRVSVMSEGVMMMLMMDGRLQGHGTLRRPENGGVIGNIGPVEGVHRFDVMLRWQMLRMQQRASIMLLQRRRVGLRQQLGLTIGQQKRQNRQNESVQNADDSQNISPTDLATAHVVFPGFVTAHFLHALVIPAGRINDAAQKQTNAADDLKPAADVEDDGGVDEDEEDHAEEAEENDEGGEADEEGGSLEGGGEDGAEVVEAPAAVKVHAIAARRRILHAKVVEAEVAGHRGVGRVADPLRLHEHHAVDDGEAERQTSPQDADRPRVAHVVGVIDVRRDRSVGIHGGRVMV